MDMHAKILESSGKWQALVDGIGEEKLAMARILMVDDGEAQREGTKFNHFNRDNGSEWTFEDLSDDVQKRLLDEAGDSLEESLKDLFSGECNAYLMMQKAIREA